MKKLSLTVLSATSAMALAACAPTAETTSTQSSSSTSAAAATETGAEMETEETVMVGGAEMLPSRTIVANASEASNLTTLVSAVQSAGLVDTLSGPGPFTVFAPTNDAFSRLPAGTVDALMTPQGQAQLRQILTFHVVPGDLDAAELMQRIEAGSGTATLTTVEGSDLTFGIENGAVAVTDEQGTTSFVTQADVDQSNGVVHVINGVLIPNPEMPQNEPQPEAADPGMDDSAM